MGNCPRQRRAFSAKAVSSTNVEVSISKGITYVFINLMFARKRSLYWLFALPGTENPASIILTL